MQTIKFYTSTNKYMGWIKQTNFNGQVLELRSWLKSGNYLKINKIGYDEAIVINKVENLKLIWEL